MHDEASKYGKVEQVTVDKQGLVYILYDTADTASKALKVFNGRLFSGNCIAAEFYPLELYREKHPEH